MDIIPRHQWTHNGDRVLVVRSGATGYGGFQWPTTIGARLAVVQPTRDAACDAGGYYGWPWAFGLGDGKEPDWSARWIVFAAHPRDVIAIGDKIKCCGEIEIIHVGDWVSATAYVLPGQMAWVEHAAQGAASATGLGGAAMVTGVDGRACAGVWGCLALAWWNPAAQRAEMRCARVGCGDGSDGLLRAGVWYRLNADGEFIEV